MGRLDEIRERLDVFAQMGIGGAVEQKVVLDDIRWLVDKLEAKLSEAREYEYRMETMFEFLSEALGIIPGQDPPAGLIGDLDEECRMRASRWRIWAGKVYREMRKRGDV